MTSGRRREQAGHRPAVVVAGERFLDLLDTLTFVVPVSSIDRGWPNHVLLSPGSGLPGSSYAMCEQLRTIARGRITSAAGRVDPATFEEIRTWLGDFLDLPTLG